MHGRKGQQCKAPSLGSSLRLLDPNLPEQTSSLISFGPRCLPLSAAELSYEASEMLTGPAASYPEGLTSSRLQELGQLSAARQSQVRLLEIPSSHRVGGAERIGSHTSSRCVQIAAAAIGKNVLDTPNVNPQVGQSIPLTEEPDYPGTLNFYST